MMLYLDSVDAKEISFMLDYIYQGEVKKKGEVSIHQEYLDRFIEITYYKIPITWILWSNCAQQKLKFNL